MKKETKATKATNTKANASVNANATSKKAASKKETATEKAARLAEREKAREQKAAQKELEKAERKMLRAAKLDQQKAETKQRHENAKSAISYNTYGAIVEARTATPFAACKHFYLDMQTACGGALCRVLQNVIGENKRDFAEIYGDKVRAKAAEIGAAKFTAFLVWRVLWQDLQTLTKGTAATDADLQKAVNDLRARVEERAEIAKAMRAEKAAKKAAK